MWPYLLLAKIIWNATIQSTSWKCFSYLIIHSTCATVSNATIQSASWNCFKFYNTIYLLKLFQMQPFNLLAGIVSNVTIQSTYWRCLENYNTKRFLFLVLIYNVLTRTLFPILVESYFSSFPLLSVSTSFCLASASLSRLLAATACQVLWNKQAQIYLSNKISRRNHIST